MTKHDDPIEPEFVSWLKEERTRLQCQLDVLSSGACRTGYNAGAGWVDNTAATISQLETSISALDRLIGDKLPRLRTPI
jgi:hypothetical protein